MNRPPLVSAIVPVHNGEDYLAEALASIAAQTHENMEIIVVDDGSTDGSERLARAVPDLRYLRQPNSGPAAARNRGLQIAGGDFIAFLDADDIWPPGKVERQLRELRADPALSVVLGRLRPLGSASDEQGSFAFVVGCALFRRDAFERVGVFDAQLRYSEDVDWFLRAREQGLGMVALDEIMLLMRWHDASVTHGRDAVELNLTRVLRRSLERRRADGSCAGRLENIPGVRGDCVKEAKA